MNLFGFTWCDLLGHPLRYHIEVFKGGYDSFHVAKHGGQAQREEHDEEQYGPHLRAWHLYDCFSECDKSQACPWRSLSEQEDGAML